MPAAMRWLLLAVVLLTLTPAGAVALGAPVGAMTFKDIRYLPRTLDDFGAVSAYAFVFFCSACPESEKALEAFAASEAAYRGHGVQFAAINSGDTDSIRDMAWQTLQREIHLPVLKDRDTSCATAMGVDNFATVVVLDADRRLCYRGNVDGFAAALDAVLAGATVAVSETAVAGKPITAPADPKAEGEVTWASDIAPIMNQHCVSCHSAEGQGPFALTSYKKVAAYSDMIAEVMTEGRMPPWYAHPAYGEFRDDRSVPASDRLRVRQWIAAGMPEGDPARAPEPVLRDPQGWAIAPDVVIEAKSMSALPKSGFVPYQYMFLPYEFTEDTYVQGIEIKPSNPKVLHHGNLFFTRGGLNVDQAKDFLTGTVPGGMPSVLDSGNAWVIPKGARLCLQLHYVTTGKLESNRMSVGLRFARGVVNKRLYYKNLDDAAFKIPPHDRAFKLVSADTLAEDATGLGLFGHMHLRGRDMTFYAYYPDGRKEVLMTMPNYNFDWQLTYRYPPNAYRFPAGTKIECVAHYDNSAFNPYNPAPEREVPHGEQTVDEMLNGFFVYTHDAEQLNLRVDPNSGHAIEQVAANN